MNNQEIISRAISYNNSEINAVKSVNNVLSKSLQKKEDKIIELNTDALAGLELPEDVTSPEISNDRLLDLFGFDSIVALYNAMSKLDNKIFALKPTLESFKVGNTSYTITNCIPCVGKMIPYGDARVFMLTFIFNTINSYMRTMTLFIDGNSMTDVKGRISIEELSSGSSSELPDDISDTITTLQGEVDTLKETSVTKTSLDTTLGGYSTTGHTHSEYLTEHQDISGKQDIISDLDTIRSGAAKGATALQSVPAEYITETELNGKGYATSSYVNGELAKKSDSGHTHSEYLTEHQDISGKADKSSLATVATSGSYNDLSNKPTIPAAVTESTVSGWGFTKNTGTYIKPGSGIPKSDLASAVQTSLGKADTALQSYTEQYKGTVEAVDTTETIDGVSNDFVTSEQLDARGYATTASVNSQINTVNQSIATLDTTVGTNNSGKNLVERVTQLEDGIGVPDARAKVLWLGTSIPAGDPGNNYPSMVGEMLGFEIHNMSQAASCLHWDPTPPTWTTSAEVEANRTAGRCLTATRQEIRDKFYTVLDNIRRTERLSTTWRDNLIAEFQEASYETRVIPYLDGTIASCDTVVIDHGFNDMMAIYNECVQHANTAKDETSYWPDDVAASMGLPSGIAYPTPDGVKGWHWLTNLSTGRDYYADTFMNTIYTTALGLMDGYADTTFRYEYFGAFMFLIAKIMKVNPRARIVVGNYFSQNCGDFIDSRSSWLTKYVLEANQQLANWLGYLCVNTYKYTGLRNRLIVRPDGTQVYDMYLFCPADGVHPSTDTTGESNRLLAGIYINALRGLFFK